MLKGIIPRMFPEDVHPVFVVFEGKQDLERQLERRMRGWRVPDSVFLVMRDKDAGDCMEIKRAILEKVKRAGKEAYSLV